AGRGVEHLSGVLVDTADPGVDLRERDLHDVRCRRMSDTILCRKRVSDTIFPFRRCLSSDVRSAKRCLTPFFHAAKMVSDTPFGMTVPDTVPLVFGASPALRPSPARDPRASAP